MKTMKIPMRRCVVSKESVPKSELTRIVVNKEGEVAVDSSGKMNGRGAYILLNKKNVAAARKKNILEKVLKVNNLDEIYTTLEELCDE